MKPSNTNPLYTRPAASRGPLVLAAAALATLLALISIVATTTTSGIALGAGAPAIDAALKVSGAASSPQDCGLFWRVVSSSNPSNILNSLNSVDAISPNDVWAVGYSVVMTNPGETLPLVDRKSVG